MDAGAQLHRTETKSRGDRAQVKLGRYEVVRELGKGAMGIVYLAKDPLIGRLVALKTIRLAAHSDDEEAKEFQQRFIREAQAAGILNHPSIVTVHDIGQDEATGTSFIAMEYVEGQNLKEVLAQGRPLTFEQIAQIVVQVAEALDFAHSKGIIHRDVKPANIILVEGNRAKITDFGIAKIASGSVNLTTTGQFLGTPNYMAPEQIKGIPVDGRSDIFSVGICLYECLTRRKPFAGDSLTSISYKIVHEPFPPLREINPQIPDGFEGVVAKCLAKEPGKRYQRGRDLAGALQVITRGERPAPPPEPVLADETVVTREHVIVQPPPPPPPPPQPVTARDEKIPTVEIPFPEAIELEGTPTKPRTTVPADAVAASGIPAAVSTSGIAEPEPIARPRRQLPPLRQQLRTTLTSVQAYPAWKLSVPPYVFLSIVAVLVAALIAAVVIIQSKHPEIRPVDTKAEAQRARERQLRIAGNTLWQQGRIHEAYAKFVQLRQLAPKSPFVNALLQRMEAIRQREEIGRQQLALAQQKVQEGIALYNDKKYPEAISVLEEAFHLNPSSDDAANYLKLAQQEEQKVEEAQAKAKQAARVASATPPHAVTAAPPSTTMHSSTAGNGTRPAANNTPAQITTYFDSPFSDGYIMVKAGGQVVAHENLWEEKGRIFRRRTPRVVNVTKEIPPANTDVEIWVVIPSMKIQEHKVISRNFRPGASHKLMVSFDQPSKKFNFELN